MPILTRESGPDPDANCVWVGVRGFEDRSLSSLFAISVDRLVAIRDLEYTTRLAPAKVGQDRIERNKRLLGEYLSLNKMGQRRVSEPLDSYSIGSMTRALVRAEREASMKRATLVVDISSMTGLHAVAVAAWLHRGWTRHTPVALAYSIPHQYVYPEWRVVTGWRDTVLAPVCPDPVESIVDGQFALAVVEGANAITLMGGDGLRTEWALGQLDLTSVWYVLAHDSDDPGDLAGAGTRRAHDKLLKRCEESGVLGQRRRSRGACYFVEVEKCDLMRIRLLAESAMSASMEEAQRLFVLPFGPRIVTVTAVLAALSVSSLNTWCCYPIPDRVFADGSNGVKATHWFTVLI